ncbi:hypothetical protein [Saccharibacillus sacchari]|uniref:Uncharacterized protein n=1 Tax=Saccharibacillus sacchari TaxID=456493 RepID=A0ACC6PFN0_9BACL
MDKRNNERERSAAEGLAREQARQEAFWIRYLYRVNSREELKRWANKLRYMRFCRAYGGHSNDGDRLLAAISVPSRERLEAVCEVLGIALLPMRPRRENEAFSFFEIKKYPDLRQPGHAEIARVPVYVWVHRDRLTISVSDPDDRYSVKESTVSAVAERVEPLLRELADLLIDPPQNDRNCICPQQHPELFRS